MKIDLSRYCTAFRYFALVPLAAFGLLSILATGESKDNGGTAPPPTVSSQLAFRADDGVTGAELWKSDGTAGGTAMVANINSIDGSDPSEFTVF